MDFQFLASCKCKWEYVTKNGKNKLMKSVSIHLARYNTIQKDVTRENISTKTGNPIADP